MTKWDDLKKIDENNVECFTVCVFEKNGTMTVAQSGELGILAFCILQMIKMSAK